MSQLGMSEAALASLLEEFARAPGNFPVKLREPRELYDQLEIISAWAIGKLPTEFHARYDTLRLAAVLFIQRACFAPGNNFYEVLGLEFGRSDSEALRTRYRALIRVTPPDMGVEGLPAMAASTLNRAYEVLSDDVARIRYDLACERDQLFKRSVGTVAPFRRIDLQMSYADRYKSLLARYPVFVRFGFALVGALTVGSVLFVGAALVSKSSTTTIVMRQGDSAGLSDAKLADARASAASLRTQAPLKPPRELTSEEKASASARSFVPFKPNSLPDYQARNIPIIVDSSSSIEGSVERKSFPDASRDASARTPEARLSLYALRQFSVENESVAENPTGPVASAPSSPVLSIFAGKAVTQTSASQGPAHGGLPPPTPVAALAQSQNRQAQQQLPNSSLSAAPSSSSPVSARPPSSQTGAGGLSATFPVDVVRAKSYLTDILMSLERLPSARNTNAYLSEMNVQGSLLQPALQLMRKYPDINVEKLAWQDTVKPGVMKVHGTVMVTARNTGLTESRRVAFQLQAEFWGMRDGTFLASLNLKEEE